MRGLGSILRSTTTAATRLAGAVVGVALLSLTIAILVGWTSGRDLARDLAEDGLDARRSTNASDVAFHLSALGRTTSALAGSSAAVDAIDAFSAALAEFSGSLTEAQTEQLVEHHRTRFVEPLHGTGRAVDVTDVVPADGETRKLQYDYAVDLGAFTSAVDVVDSGDGSNWSAAHRLYHPVYRDVVERRELIDLYLIESRTARIVYSVGKGPDLGTSLQTGLFSGSLLATMTRRVIDDPGAGVRTSDLEYYPPAVLEPVGVAAAPVFDGDRLVGIVAVTYGASPITEIVAAGHEERGDGGGADAYLVGRDGTLRSDPRAFIEDPQAFLDAAEAAGSLSGENRDRIEAADTTVLVLRANDATTRAGFGDDETLRQTSTIDGERAFSAVAPVDVAGPEWLMVVETVVTDAQADLRRFREGLIIGTALFVVALSFLAVAWAARVLAPVRAVSDGLVDPNPETAGIDVSSRSPAEFVQLSADFDAIAGALVSARRDLESAGADRRRVRRRLVPETVAARIGVSDEHVVEEAPDAVVVVVVFDGRVEEDEETRAPGDAGALGFERVPADRDSADREFVEDVISGLDGAAARHGLERIKVVGDAYVAACGHDRPSLDHLPRAIAFALQACDTVDDAAAALGVSLRARVGLGLGPVSVGMVGPASPVYDVWGETVRTAHRMARLAAPGEVLVPGDVQHRVPDGLELVPVDDRTGVSSWRLESAGQGEQV